MADRASSSPASPGSPPEHFIHDGIIYIRSCGRDLLQNMKYSSVRKGDVFIAGYPKSGAHWIITIVKALAQLDKLDKFEQEGLMDAKGGPYEIVSVYEHLSKKVGPRLAHTHLRPSLLPEELKTRGKVIHVMRNPLDVAVSYYHFHTMCLDLGCYQGTWEQFFEFFIAGQVAWGGWSEFIADWLTTPHGFDVMNIHYEDMISNPFEGVRCISRFLGYEATDAQINEIVRITSFSNMRQNPNLSWDDTDIFRPEICRFMREGKVGNWKKYFTKEQRERTDKEYQELVKKTGTTFTFE